MQTAMFDDVLPVDDPNSRYIPRELAERWQQEFRFTRDVASAGDAPSSQVIGAFWTKADNALTKSWFYDRVYCNPPFDDIETWVLKAWAEFRAGCPLIVMLLPVRTDRPWWQKHVEPFRDRPGSGLRTKFLERIPFGSPGNPEGRGVDDPNFWCVQLIWENA